jgi:hypothetical protein
MLMVEASLIHVGPGLAFSLSCVVARIHEASQIELLENHYSREDHTTSARVLSNRPTSVKEQMQIYHGGRLANFPVT